MGIGDAPSKDPSVECQECPGSNLSKSQCSRPVDELTGVEVNEEFDRFEQKNDIYCRAVWDDEIKSDKAAAFFDGYFMPSARILKADGYGLRDYAFRNAAWHATNVFRDIEKCGEYRDDSPSESRKEGYTHYFTSHDEGWPEPYPFKNPEQATHDIRRVAELCGVGVLGICAYDERWMYKSVYNRTTGESKPQEIPSDLPYVIVTAAPMDQGLIRTVPSALSGAATGLGYSYETIAVITLAQFIRNLGYRAFASLNDSALSIPLGLQAGLGEAGRNGSLISEEYGPRFRIGKIFTDVPLVVDSPKHLGVTQFCNICDRCAKACPPKAIPFDEPSTNTHSKSNIRGVKKWTTVAEKCFRFWTNQNTDCIICVRVCPYNRDYSKLRHRLWMKVAKSRFRRLALLLDDWFMDRSRTKSRHWWRTVESKE